MGTKIALITKNFIEKIKKIILKIIKFLCSPIILIIYKIVGAIILLIGLISGLITIHDFIFPSVPTQNTNTTYITNLAPAENEHLICKNFFNNSALSKGIDQFVIHENKYKLKEGVIFADLVCKEELPVNFSAKVEFIPKNNGVINFGLSEYSNLSYNIFRIIIGDSGSTNIVIKDKNNNNLKIKYYSDSQYSEKLSLKDPISPNNIVRLKITQEKILNSQVELTIALDYTPIGDTTGRLVTANIKAVIENTDFLSDLKYLIGIGMYRSYDKTDDVEIEFLNFQIKEFTM